MHKGNGKNELFALPQDEFGLIVFWQWPIDIDMAIGTPVYVLFELGGVV